MLPGDLISYVKKVGVGRLDEICLGETRTLLLRQWHPNRVHLWQDLQGHGDQRGRETQPIQLFIGKGMTKDDY